jgi:Spy/CpxP family protein refolding chaperone
MMRIARIALPLVVALLISSPLLAAGKKCDVKKAAACPAAQRVDKIVAGLTLTDAQKTSLADVKKTYGPKLVAALKKLDVQTPEQKKAAAKAVKDAKAAGKTGKEVHQAVAAAVNLTDAQKTQLADAKKSVGALEKELRHKVMAVLTPEQKEQVKKAHQAKKQKQSDK